MPVYPKLDSPEFHRDIFKKREFYYYRTAPSFRPLTHSEILDYQNYICNSNDFQMQDHQQLLASFINPSSPYTGLLIFHGTGSGKTCGAIAVAEGFVNQVEKYNTKIHVLVPGPILKQEFKDHLIKCTGETYINDIDNYKTLSNEKQQAELYKAYRMTTKSYVVMSYKTFHRKVLGEKIPNYDSESRDKKTYKKNVDGTFERTLMSDNLDNLNNSLLIIDEAHNITGDNNEYGLAVKKIIAKSTNLRVLLLTATPMKNVASDIIDLLNMLRPKDSRIVKKKIFRGTGHNMEFEIGGIEYLQQMATGYVSYFRGGNPYTFAEKKEMGEVRSKIKFTPLIHCMMKPFQLEAYRQHVQTTDMSTESAENVQDPLDRISEQVSNFVFPGIKNNKIMYLIGEVGQRTLINQLNQQGDEVNNIINKEFFGGVEKNVNNLVYYNSYYGTVSGKIFKLPYLDNFSIKFSTCMRNILSLFTKLEEEPNGTSLCFVYSNLVQMGVMLFQQVLLNNGFLEYSSDRNYSLNNNTLHYKHNITYEQWKTSDEMKKKYPKFEPAVFLTITGKIDDPNNLEDNKHKFVKSVFNKVNNMHGKNIKVLIGSKVVNEGITFQNIRQIHVLDAHYHLGRLDQVIGRGIRHCAHFNSITSDYPKPFVEVYRYVVSKQDGDTRSEQMYQKAENKYILVKKTERILKEISIDCPLNHSANMIMKELEEHKNCTTIEEVLKDSSKKKTMCPASCEFDDCRFKCHSKPLNTQYYDPSNGVYKMIQNSHLDHSTFNITLARKEINAIKKFIKDLYYLKNKYSFQQICDEVKNHYPEHKKDMYSNDFVFKALNELIPDNTTNMEDFNDFIKNKYKESGYVLYNSNTQFYIFQPYDTKNSHHVLDKNLNSYITAYSYVNNVYKNIVQNVNSKTKHINFDFDSVLDYYKKNQLGEYDIVGRLDQKKNTDGTYDQVFKIRPKLPTELIKKRQKGQATIAGTVCYNSINIQGLHMMAKKLNVSLNKDESNRSKICNLLKERLIYFEKYATNTNSIPKKVYVYVPINHPKYEFPLNLVDKIDYLQQLMDVKFTSIQKHQIDKNDNNIVQYTVSFTYNILEDLAKKHGFVKKGNKWERVIS